jgi:putative colanic acid biosynthesis acetyltransferase WcaF
MENTIEKTSATRYQALASFKLPPGFRGKPGWYVQLWWIVQSTLFGLSPQILYGWRRWLLQCFGMKGAKGLMIRPTAIVTYPWKITMGQDCWVGDHAVLYSLGEIEIGDNCVVSQRSYLCAATHDYTVPSFDMVDKKITIEPEVWLAADCFVAPGVRIGRGSVVGARSSVFGDLPGGMVCVGSPAKAMRPRVMRETGT